VDFEQTPGPTELSLKLICNSISTGASVQKGRVYGNKMINMGIR
jgi:N-acetylmuramic acid 6-phosphate (MurNAc-6-P) etherase